MNQIGKAGEDLACELLTGKGYAIIRRNAIVGGVEVDIIAQHDSRLIIVEVKTRKADHWDTRFGIDREKILRLCRAGASYVKSQNLPLEVQIDAVLVVNNPDGSQTIDHLEDIALPPRRRRR
ncbi:MAG: YraN family protein [Muribaculaceae bacterium]|nr:YraN family protein [Muribaculaceae bacterium]